jgi:hypothetical protein
MSTSAYTSFSNRKSILLIIETGTSIKTDGITKLTKSQTTIRYRRHRLSICLLGLMLRMIVLENLQQPFNATTKELWLYWKIVKNSLAILIQTLTPEILPLAFVAYYQIVMDRPTFSDTIKIMHLFYSQLWKVMLFYQDIGVYKILAFIQLYENE